MDPLGLAGAPLSEPEPFRTPGRRPSGRASSRTGMRDGRARAGEPVVDPNIPVPPPSVSDPTWESWRDSIEASQEQRAEFTKKWGYGRSSLGYRRVDDMSEEEQKAFIAARHDADLRNRAEGVILSYGMPPPALGGAGGGDGGDPPGTYRDARGRLRDSATHRFVEDPLAKYVDAESSSTHGNAKDSPVPATLYARFDKMGKFLKWGISQDAARRYSQEELEGGYVTEYRVGSREEMLALERRLTERHPGPLNREPWAGVRDPNHPNYQGGPGR